MMSEEFKKTFKRLNFSAQDNELIKNMTEYRLRVDKQAKRWN
jgi:hypothetical protein